MESLIEFFENVPTSFRTGLLLGGIVLFWMLEGVLPMFKFGYRKFHHGALNMFFNLTTAIVGFGLAGALLWTSNFTQEHSFGLLHIFEMPLWAEVMVGILLLDLIGAYFIHWLEHKVKWMWKFHLIHHSDTNVDVTSGLRHHPGETVFRIFFTICAVMIVGAPMGIVMFYQSLSVLFAHITHANIQMPEKVDKALSYVFVTPYMHKVHHHYQQPLTDTNYGNIFSIWDRLFQTFAEVKDRKSIKYGVDTHMDSRENTQVGNLLAIPFQKYRTPESVKLENEKV